MTWLKKLMSKKERREPEPEQDQESAKVVADFHAASDRLIRAIDVFSKDGKLVDG